MIRRLVVAALVASAGLTSAFAAADLSVSVGSAPQRVGAARAYSVSFVVRNDGPDAATGVTVNGASSVDLSCSGCNAGNIPAGRSVTVSMPFVAPRAEGALRITATATSTSADPNPANNSASADMIVSLDPDLRVSVFGLTPLDPGALFNAGVAVANEASTSAHDVSVTLTFDPGIRVQSTPAYCTTPSSGTIVCRFNEVLPFAHGDPLTFTVRLIAPASRQTNTKLAFDATVAERENDFDPSNNHATAPAELIDTFYVTTMADSGAGSLRQAMLDANVYCTGEQLCAIAFHIAEPSGFPWKTIRVSSPLPPLTAMFLRIDGATQTLFSGDTNPDGPEVEISGGGDVTGDGLVVTKCATEVANLAIGGFLRNGISVVDPVAASNRCTGEHAASLHHLYIGTDPTGEVARPNERGIGLSVDRGPGFTAARNAAAIASNVISGNIHSGIFDLSGRILATANRIGVKAHSDEPLPNGNSGIFVGAADGSDIGTTGFTVEGSVNDPNANVIAYNGQMGVSIARGVSNVAVRNNRIWGNGLLGIDIGLDGPTPSTETVAAPSLTLAHFDPSTGSTIIEGDFTTRTDLAGTGINIYANDAADPSGFGEGQRPVAALRVQGATTHFRAVVAGNLTGQFITATATRSLFIGFAKPVTEGIDQGLLTQTSEFSRAIEVR